MKLSDLVRARIDLKERGRIHWGLCPFHPDQHPSLAVYDASGDDPAHYHCFACEAHGDALDWLMKIEGLSFPEAKKKLGEDWVPTTRKRPRLVADALLGWPEPGVEHQEVALLRERLVQSSWSNEQTLFWLWSTAPTLDDEQLRLRHPYASEFVIARLRKIYPKP
jgi:hypothetical protein